MHVDPWIFPHASLLLGPGQIYTFPLWIDWYNISRVWNNITKIKYSIMNIGIITRVNGVWFVHKLQFNVTSDHLKLVNTEKKSCTKCCTNQKCMSNQVDTPFSSPQVCFVFGRIAWPVLCHFCMGSLHDFSFKHHATVPWTFTHGLHGEFTYLHPGRHKEVTLTMQPVSQTARCYFSTKTVLWPSL